MLSQRLQALVNLIPTLDTIIDVGCDHGLLTQVLLTQNKCRYVIASDTSRSSLAKCQRLLLAPDFQGRYDLRLGDGLSVLTPGEAQGCVIAGMGGQLISRILDHPHSQLISVFALQPVSRPDVLRRYLRDHSFTVQDEALVYENGKYQFILRAGHGQGAWGTAEDIAGPILMQKKHPLLAGYLAWQREVAKRALYSAPGETVLAQRMSAIEEALSCLSR